MSRTVYTAPDVVVVGDTVIETPIMDAGAPTGDPIADAIMAGDGDIQ